MNRTVCKILRLHLLVCFLLFATALPACIVQAQGQPESGVVVRCAVVGGLNEIDFWPQLADRFQRATGHRMEIAAVGPKHAIAEAFKSGEADVIVMHSSDAIINLVADGFGENPQPWAKNDFVIVGPASDPAKIKGDKDAVAALGKIIASRSKLLLHASSGVNELVGDLLAAGELELDPQATISLPGDKHRQMLKRAAAEQAYTLVGRIPFLSGKLDTGELAIMVQGDERLRRPYLVVVAARPGDRRLEPARRFAAFLREPATQEFIAGFGSGKFDERPLLFPVKTPR
ncbi:MAG TPA: substrate-binding domain-containing protein [Pirellulaceae bacterium]|nr:substrate-binding domain-containing protein [Pirellulaceae bacterium]